MKRVLLIGVSLLAMASAARAAETPPFAYTGAVVTWTVPVAGVYDILAAGAQGGSAYVNTGGLGAEAGGAFSLYKGEILDIVVGGAGGSYSWGGGGGGGSFVYHGTTLLVAAGGGGGAGFGGTKADNFHLTYSNTSYAGGPGQAGVAGEHRQACVRVHGSLDEERGREKCKQKDEEEDRTDERGKKKTILCFLVRPRPTSSFLETTPASPRLSLSLSHVLTNQHPSLFIP